MPATKVPKLDPDITGALADDYNRPEDRRLMKIQAAVLATSTPLANFWSHLTEQGFEGKDDEYVAVGDVLDVMKSSLMLIGNASHYITQTRRRSIIDTTKKSRPKPASFLQDICKGDLGDTGEDLFGPEARKKIVERANTIDAFNKAVGKVDPTTKRSRKCWSFFVQRLGRILRGRTEPYRHPVPKEGLPQVQPKQNNQKSNHKRSVVRKQIVSKEKPVARPFPIGGSLRTHYQAWKSLTDNSWVL